MELTRLNSNYRRVNVARRNNSGDPCPVKHCAGSLVVYATKINGDYRERFLHCGCCGHLPENNKVIVPLEYAPAHKNLRTKPSTDGD